MSENFLEQKEPSEADAQADITTMASHIVNNRHLGHILRQVQVRYRRGVYEQIKPYLTFKAKPYFLFK